MVDLLVVGVVQWLHVFLGIFWFGTVLYTRLVLFPSLGALPADTAIAVRSVMVRGYARRWTYLFSYGTVAMGIVRGAVGGVFDELTTAYGFTYLAALAIGVLMLAFNFSPLFEAPIYRKLYVAGFPVMFTLMVLMRFGY